jgi:hypothetical protein
MYLSLFAKGNSKWIEELNPKPESMKLKKIYKKNLSEHQYKQFFGYDLKSISNKSKNRKMGLHCMQRLLHSERNNQE